MASLFFCLPLSKSENDSLKLSQIWQKDAQINAVIFIHFAQANSGIYDKTYRLLYKKRKV